MEPLHSIHTAVNRTTRKGMVLGKSQQISARDALKAYTTWAALAGFEEDIKGSITPGKLADIIAVDGNPLDNISSMENVRFVMKHGEIYKNE